MNSKKTKNKAHVCVWDSTALAVSFVTAGDGTLV